MNSSAPVLLIPIHLSKDEHRSRISSGPKCSRDLSLTSSNMCSRPVVASITPIISSPPTGIKSDRIGTISCIGNNVTLVNVCAPIGQSHAQTGYSILTNQNYYSTISPTTTNIITTTTTTTATTTTTTKHAHASQIDQSSNTSLSTSNSNSTATTTSSTVDISKSVRTLRTTCEALSKSANPKTSQRKSSPPSSASESEINKKILDIIKRMKEDESNQNSSEMNKTAGNVRPASKSNRTAKRPRCSVPSNASKLLNSDLLLPATQLPNLTTPIPTMLSPSSASFPNSLSPDAAAAATAATALLHSPETIPIQQPLRHIQPKLSEILSTAKRQSACLITHSPANVTDKEQLSGDVNPIPNSVNTPLLNGNLPTGTTVSPTSTTDIRSMTPQSRFGTDSAFPDKPLEDGGQKMIVKRPESQPNNTPLTPSQISYPTPQPVTRRCSCVRSCCLKLYCECFAAGLMCSDCSCAHCMNNPEHLNARKEAVSRLVHRNPDAFQSKIEHSNQNESIHVRGCNCKRSGCLKNYCECYEARIPCSFRCRCQHCSNTTPHPVSSITTHARSVSSTSRSYYRDNQNQGSLSESTRFSHPSSSPLSSVNSIGTESFMGTPSLHTDMVLSEPNIQPPLDAALNLCDPNPIDYSETARDPNTDSPATLDSTSSAASTISDMNMRPQNSRDFSIARSNHPSGQLTATNNNSDRIRKTTADPNPASFGPTPPPAAAAASPSLIPPNPPGFPSALFGLPAPASNLLATMITVLSNSPNVSIPQVPSFPVSNQQSVPGPLSASPLCPISNPNEPSPDQLKEDILTPLAQSKSPTSHTTPTYSNEHPPGSLSCPSHADEPLVPVRLDEDHYTEEELATFRRLRAQREQVNQERDTVGDAIQHHSPTQTIEPSVGGDLPVSDSCQSMSTSPINYCTSSVDEKVAASDLCSDTAVDLTVQRSETKDVSSDVESVPSKSSSANSVSRLYSEMAQLRRQFSRLSQTVRRQNRLIGDLRRCLVRTTGSRLARPQHV